MSDYLQILVPQLSARPCGTALDTVDTTPCRGLSGTNSRLPRCDSPPKPAATLPHRRGQVGAVLDTQRLYRIYVVDPLDGTFPVGHFYRTREMAKGWIPFVRRFWNTPCRVIWAACPLPAAHSAAEPIRNPHAETTHSASTVVGDRDGSSGAASRRSPATTQSGSVTLGSPKVQGLPAQGRKTVNAARRTEVAE